MIPSPLTFACFWQMSFFLAQPTAHHTTRLLIRAPEPRLLSVGLPDAFPLAERTLLKALKSGLLDRLRLREALIQRHELRREHASKLRRRER